MKHKKEKATKAPKAPVRKPITTVKDVVENNDPNFETSMEEFLELMDYVDKLNIKNAALEKCKTLFNELMLIKPTDLIRGEVQKRVRGVWSEISTLCLAHIDLSQEDVYALMDTFDRQYFEYWSPEGLSQIEN